VTVVGGVLLNLNIKTIILDTRTPHIKYFFHYMASLFGFGGPSAKVEIELDNAEGLQKTIEIESSENETKEERIIYSGADTIKGKVKVIIPSGKKLEHIGIKVELVGTIGTSTLRLSAACCRNVESLRSSYLLFVLPVSAFLFSFPSSPFFPFYHFYLYPILYSCLLLFLFF
jgi:hypothetical protein